MEILSSSTQKLAREKSVLEAVHRLLEATEEQQAAGPLAVTLTVKGQALVLQRAPSSSTAPKKEG